MPTNQRRLFPTPARRTRGRARRGLDESLTAIRATGRLENVDAALVALCRVAADELDAAIADTDESRYTVGTLTARYHDVLRHLLARPVGDDRDLMADLFAAVDVES